MVKKSVPSGYHNGLLYCISVSFPTCSLLVFILLLSHLGCKSQMLCLWLLCSTEGKQGKPLPPWVCSTLRKTGIKLVFSPVLFFKLPAFLGIRNFVWCTEKKGSTA